jgi:hypothetical protein
MNDGTPLGVRVQKAYMAAVLIGPTKKKWLTRSGLQGCLLNAKEKARLSTKDKVRKVTEKERHTVMSLVH